jgi:ribosome-binding factor A
VSQRVAQVESHVARVLAAAIPTLNDPRLPLIVTVERVRVTPDLLHARVAVSCIGEVAPVLEALNRAKGYLQRQIAAELRLKRTPLLEFVDGTTNF